MSKPITTGVVEVEQIVAKVYEVKPASCIELKSIDIANLKPPTDFNPSPVYWSYYVTKGSELQKKFKAIEKEMELSQSLSGTP